MKFSIPKSTLVTALSRVQGLLKQGSTNPMLWHVLISVSGVGDTGTLLLTATDTQIRVKSSYPATVEADGQIALPGKILFDVAKAAPDGEIYLSLDRNNRVKIAAGRMNTAINGLDADDYPPDTLLTAKDPLSTLTMDAVVVETLINGSIYATSKDENRYGLNGLYLHEFVNEDGPVVRLVSTDGSRLAFAQTPSGPIKMPRKTLLPPAALAEVRKMLVTGDVKISLYDRGFSVENGATTLSAIYVDGEFPDYLQVLPVGHKRRFKIDTQILSEAIRRVALFANDRNHTTEIRLREDGLTLTAEDVEKGSGSEVIDCELEGEPIRTGVNLSYIQDVINSAKGKDHLIFSMGDELDPIMLQFEKGGKVDPNMAALIMPMRLD